MGRDGLKTRQRILEAAGDIFSQKGFRRATVAEICQRAGANIAAVNYHFKSKKGLYREVWSNLLDSAARTYPLDGGLTASDPAEERLEAHIRALVDRRFDKGPIGLLHGMWMLEMINPSGLMDDRVAERVLSQRRTILKTVGELLGPEAGEELISLSEMSLFSQCRMVRPDGAPPGLARRFGRETITPGQKERLVDHIYNFSLAGMAAVRQRLEHREAVNQ